MTDSGSPNLQRSPLPPDPDAYDSPRAERARARGLAAPYIPGGQDPDPERTRREERRLLRILLAMVVIVVLGAFLLGVVENLIGG
jgi:hypothetical protein